MKMAKYVKAHMMTKTHYWFNTYCINTRDIN